MHHDSRSPQAPFCAAALALALAACGPEDSPGALLQALCPADDPDCTGGSSSLYTVKATLVVPDYREWCTSSDARASCTGNGSLERLRHARVQLRDTATGAVFVNTTTDQNGAFTYQISTGHRDFFATVDWSGTSPGGLAFKIYYNPVVSDPDCLTDNANRQTLYTGSTAWRCSGAQGSVCDLGQRTIPLTTEPAKWAAMTFLNLSYAYNESGLYKAVYHDYCRINGCADVNHHVVSIYDPDQAKALTGQSACVYDTVSDNGTNWTDSQTGFTTLVGSTTNNLEGGAVFHELGHSLHDWALDLKSTTSGDHTAGEAWANFVSHAYRVKRNAAHVYFGEVDIEDGDPRTRCDSGPPEDCGLNWQAAFWDLYDDHNTETIFSCETANSGGVKGDQRSLEFGDMLDGLDYFLRYPLSTYNHARSEDPFGGNASTRNMIDYAVNIASGNGMSYTTIEQTAIRHNCLQGLSPE